MNSKFYVSYEVEMLLKEKGCPIDGRITKAEAIDWLESKGIVVEVVFDCNMQRWYFSIHKEEKTPWIKHLSNDTFPTRLEAEEAAIIKALELL